MEKKKSAMVIVTFTV